VNNFLLSGRFLVGAAKGMCKVCRTKRFELIKRKMLSHIDITQCCGGKETYQGAAAILKHSHAELQRFLPGRLHQRMNALLNNLRVQLLARTTHAIICTSILVHQAIAVLKRLNPPGYPAVDGVDSLQAIHRELGNPPSQKLAMGSGGFIIDSCPGVARFSGYVLEWKEAAGLRGRRLIRHIKPGPSPSDGGIERSDKGVFLRPSRKKANSSTGLKRSVILIVGPHGEEKLKEVYSGADTEVSLAQNCVTRHRH
jgi:hypothetical protein